MSPSRSLPRPLRRLLYPGVLAAALLTSWLLRRAGWPEAISVSGPVALFGGLVVVLERVFPHRPEWKVGARVLGIDLAHTLLWHALVPLLLRATLLGAVVAYAPRLLGGAAPRLWPTHWPVLVQAFLALCVGELLAYLIHRFGHENPWGWRVHSVHHSPDRMHGLAAGRNHPVNVVVSYLAQVTPLLWLGVPPDVLALHAVFTGVNGPLQHANLDLATHPLGWVFSTPELHFWHHAVEVEHSNANYGSNVLVWDVLFGTRRLPRGPRLPSRVGLPHAFPSTFLGQLAWPFTGAARAAAAGELVDDVRTTEAPAAQKSTVNSPPVIWISAEPLVAAKRNVPAPDASSSAVTSTCPSSVKNDVYVSS